MVANCPEPSAATVSSGGGASAATAAAAAGRSSAAAASAPRRPQGGGGWEEERPVPLHSVSSSEAAAAWRPPARGATAARRRWRSVVADDGGGGGACRRQAKMEAAVGRAPSMVCVLFFEGTQCTPFGRLAGESTLGRAGLAHQRVPSCRPSAQCCFITGDAVVTLRNDAVLRVITGGPPALHDGRGR